MNYFYGPVFSRRLGFSLGVNLFSSKECSFDCVYCQLGPTSHSRKVRRFSCIDRALFLKELRAIVVRNHPIDYITISGQGEPTLHRDLGKIIADIKRVTARRYPVCVITNSSFLYRAKVRRELMNADLIIPSLDAGRESTFKRINKPHKNIHFAKVVRGIIALRKEFRKALWLEIMLIRGLNDSLSEARALRGLIAQIKPDKVQLNLPVRPGAKKASLPSQAQIEKIRKIIAGDVEVVEERHPARRDISSTGDVSGAIARYARVRPATEKDLVNALGFRKEHITRALVALVRSGTLTAYAHEGRKYFRPT